MNETGAWVRELPVDQRSAPARWYKRTPEWEVRDGGTARRVRVEHNVLSGRVTVHVDGAKVFSKTAWWFRHSWPFDVSGRAAVLTVVTYPMSAHSLTVDGAQLDSPSAQNALGLATPMPKWGWAFAVACLLIPLIAVGGALPMLLGIGGAGLVSHIARSNKPQSQRVGLCAVVTLAAWAMFVALVLLTAGMQSG